MILVTGAAGFIASQFVRDNPDNCVALVRMGKVGSLKRIKDTGVKCVWHDLRSPINDITARDIGDITDIVHFGAETHVDRSIAEPIPFIESNVLGTANLLEFARKIKLPGKFIQFSTDEVFGPAPIGIEHGENYPTHAQNPYAAAKAGAEQLVFAWANTYKLNVNIIRSMNIYGIMQDPEKFIPLIIKKVLAGEEMTIHASPDLKRPGSRFYTYVDDITTAVKTILDKGKVGEVYHVVGEREIDNLYMAQTIADIIGKPLKYKMVDFHSSRPGHDLRYALADNKMKDLGWSRKYSFEQAIRYTVNWYLHHKEWL